MAVAKEQIRQIISENNITSVAALFKKPFNTMVRAFFVVGTAPSFSNTNKIE